MERLPAHREEIIYVGYSPTIVFVSEKILQDFPDAHLLHVVRNPWSAYADTKIRPVQLSLENYMLGWMLTPYYALLFREKYLERVQIVRVEDVIGNVLKAVGAICEKLGCCSSDSLKTASFKAYWTR